MVRKVHPENNWLTIVETPWKRKQINGFERKRFLYCGSMSF
jgi:hypothetical protein